VRYHLRMGADLFGQLQNHAARFRPRESASLMLVGRSRTGDDETLLARRAIPLNPDAYEVQEQDRLVVHPRVINSALALCEANNLGIVFCHSHPSDIPYSMSDDEGEARLFDVFTQFLPDLPFGSLLLCPDTTFGRVWMLGPQHQPLDSIQLVGPTLKTILVDETMRRHSIGTRPEFDRQARALGEEGQTAVSQAKVAIVGLGGTGTPTAEQLVRLGVRDLVLIDPDVADETTITRGYGIFPEHLDASPGALKRLLGIRSHKTPKVAAVAKHLRRIAPSARIIALQGDVVETAVARRLLDRTVIFCCVDEHWGRAVLNQLSYQYLIPVINLGVRLDVRDGKMIGAAGSVQVLRQGVACLWCGAQLSSERIRAEGLSAKERAKLESESYVVGVETRAPMVISLTTTLSGLAVTAFLHLVTGFLGDDATFARQNYFIQEGIVSRGVTNVKDHCLCAQALGFGDLKPLPTVRSRPR
jgi:molybdopterin/thiamine biosynthesis adenylyltransferase